MTGKDKKETKKRDPKKEKRRRLVLYAEAYRLLRKGEKGHA